MVKNAYIHIPFCKSKCGYCSFVSYPQIDRKNLYLQSLEREIKHFYKEEKLNTLYIGGGTPSVFDVSEVKSLISLFRLENEAEVTMEMNPENLSAQYLEAIKNCGVNRISIGCQTFNDEILKLILRRHNADQVISAVRAAKDCGYTNISLDFIYGLPQQTVQDFITDLEKAADLDIQHISLYGLKIEEGCKFFSNPPKNIAGEDVQAQMYLEALKVTERLGFKHYEISNFAKEGFYSRHNLNYWDNNSYYGFGIAAHGYVDGVRYSNFCDFENYFKNPLLHAVEHVVSDEEKLEEEIFLGFRRTSGINTDFINKKFGINFEKKYANVIEKYLDWGHLERTAQGYKLTNEGILVSNVILSEFLH